MIYYVIGLYMLVTLWYSTHCSTCYFAKPPLVVSHITSYNNVTGTIPLYQVKTCSVRNHSF